MTNIHILRRQCLLCVDEEEDCPMEYESKYEMHTK